MNEMHVPVSNNLIFLEKIAWYIQENMVDVILKSFLLQHQAVCTHSCVCVCVCVCVKSI